MLVGNEVFEFALHSLKTPRLSGVSSSMHNVFHIGTPPTAELKKLCSLLLISFPLLKSAVFGELNFRANLDSDNWICIERYKRQISRVNHE
jgi:hypothetical protein